MKSILGILFILILSLSSCTNVEDQLKEDIHRIHDVETMPKMGYMNKLKNNLDTLSSMAPKAITKLQQQLDDADDAMMDWMVQFNWPSKETPENRRISYYKDEIEKLNDMKTTMYSAISDAEKALGIPTTVTVDAQ